MLSLSSPPWKWYSSAAVTGFLIAFAKNDTLFFFLFAATVFLLCGAVQATSSQKEAPLDGRLPRRVIRANPPPRRLDTCFLNFKEAQLLEFSVARASSTRVPTLMLTLKHQGGSREGLDLDGEISTFGPGTAKVAFSSLNDVLDDPAKRQKLNQWRVSGITKDWSTLAPGAMLKPVSSHLDIKNELGAKRKS